MEPQKNLLTKIGETIDQHRTQQRERQTGQPIRQPGRLRRFVRWLTPNGGALLLVALLIATQGVWARNLPAPAAPTATSTGTIAYQGRLADAGGAPLTGTYTMIFRIYNAATGSVPLWTEQWTGSNSVQVSDGLFNVMLGSMTAISQTMITGNNNLWLGITVGSDDEMLPRVQLGSVPFAVQALTVPDNSITAAKIADGTVTLSKLGEQPYYFTGALATPIEWMADAVFNGNYARFCQAIGRTFSRADELQSHFTDAPATGIGQGNGHFYTGWYYVGTRVDSADTHVYGNGDPGDNYNVWKYNGGAGVAISRASWTYERSAIIWCKP
jgi:hypothetical protein